ncbi:MAG: hypothetical protein GC162_11505 [Planctomycetes bacterium]|nr:hypothetical protein [Planctomycetota bacterium]
MAVAIRKKVKHSSARTAPKASAGKGEKGKVRRMAKDEKGGQDQNLDQVRDLLFGAQMREADKRFVAMEERLQKEANALRDEIRKRFDSLENYVKTELESLTERLKKEQAERMAALKTLTKDLADTAKQLEKFAEATGEEQQKMRAQMLEQSKMLRDELVTANDAQTAARVAAVAELRDEKTDRHALAAMLNEMAMQLSGKGAKPAKK